MRATVRLNLCFFRSFLVFGAFVLLLLVLQKIYVRNLISRKLIRSRHHAGRGASARRKAVLHNGVVFYLTGTWDGRTRAQNGFADGLWAEVPLPEEDPASPTNWYGSSVERGGGRQTIACTVRHLMVQSAIVAAC